MRKKNVFLFCSMFFGMILLFSGCGGGDEAPVLSSISITTPATKTVYYEGDSLDITGLVVTGTYSDGTTKAETVSISNITGFDTTTLGTKTLTITIGGKTTTYTIEVKTVEISSISITTPATKTVYYEGDSTLDITGLEVTGSYNNSTTKVETVLLSNISGFDTTTLGTKTLTITIGGKTTTYTIEVKTVEISSISITTPATKTVYYEGDSTLDITGLEVTGTYNNGTTKVEPVLISNISGFDITTLGTKTLTITIGGKTTTYTIEVKEVVAVTAKTLVRSLDILNLKQYSINMDVFGNKANKILFLDTNDVSPTEINVVSNKAETTELYVNLNITEIKIQAVDSQGNPLGSIKTITLP